MNINLTFPNERIKRVKAIGEVKKTFLSVGTELGDVPINANVVSKISKEEVWSVIKEARINGSDLVLVELKVEKILRNLDP